MQAPFADPLSAVQKAPHLLPLAGRETEMYIIRSLLETVIQDKPVGARALMMSGDVGVGKSRLLAELFAEAGERGFRLFQARAYEAWGAFPYLPFIEALRPLIRTTPRDLLRSYLGLDASTLATSMPVDSERVSISLTGKPLVEALARLFPELPGLLDITLVHEALSQDQEKFRLLDAIATLLERVALESPVLLAIDDLQWADSASLELTMYLSVRLHNSRVLLAGVTRPPGASRASTPLLSAEIDPVSNGPSQAAALKALGELMRQGLLLVLPLGPLSGEERAQHLHALLPGSVPDNVAATLLDRSGGNPFFLEELVRMLVLNRALVQEDGSWRLSRASISILPESIATAVVQRLQSLTPACQETLRIASLFGRGFPLTALAQVMNESEEEAQTSIDEAMHASLLTRDMATGENEVIGLLDAPLYEFSQRIVQEVLSSQVPAWQARALHGAIGEALESFYGGRALPAELARHYLLGERREAALCWSMLAGEHALRQQAYREAIGHFQAALRLVEQGITLPPGQRTPLSPAQLRFSIGQGWFKLGELRLALEELQQALEQTRLEADSLSPLFKAQMNRVASDIYRMQGHYEMARSHLQAARHAIDLASATDITDGSSIIIESLQVDREERILLYQAQAMLDLMLLRPEAAEAAYWQSHQLAVEVGDRESQAFALHLIGWIRGWGERIHEAIRLQEQSHALYTSIGDPFRAALVDQGLGIIYQALGEMERARLHNLRGLEQARRYGVRHVLGWLYWNQGVMALAEGNWAACESYFEQAAQEAELTDNARLKPVILQAQAEVCFRVGKWQRAESLFQSSILAAINTEWHVSAIAMYGHFLAVTGRRAEARIQLERAIVLPEPIGYSGHFYVPFLAEGFLHLDGEVQATTYIERIRALRGFMYYGVAVDRIRGEVAAQAGDWEGAERAFEDGLALCRKTRNEPEEAAILYEQARMELARAGKQHSPELLTLVDALCEQARAIFSRYAMSRAVVMVDTLRDGARQLNEPGHSRAEDNGASELPLPDEDVYVLDQKLTRREQEVLRLVAEGHTDREVAETLVISHRTVNRHLSNIFVKLDVAGRAAAVAFAIRQGLVA
jgi:DNA-binding NarL/FixJ family response regulator